jgi:hypothetical protein
VMAYVMWTSLKMNCNILKQVEQMWTIDVLYCSGKGYMVLWGTAVLVTKVFHSIQLLAYLALMSYNINLNTLVIYIYIYVIHNFLYISAVDPVTFNLTATLALPVSLFVETKTLEQGSANYIWYYPKIYLCTMILAPRPESEEKRTNFF